MYPAASAKPPVPTACLSKHAHTEALMTGKSCNAACYFFSQLKLQAQVVPGTSALSRKAQKRAFCKAVRDAMAASYAEMNAVLL